MFTKGDIAIVQLLLAAEIIETDLWQQYRELGGVEAMGGPNQGYITALEQLDGRCIERWFTLDRKTSNVQSGYGNVVLKLANIFHPSEIRADGG
jgi:hypothetical protein